MIKIRDAQVSDAPVLAAAEKEIAKTPGSLVSKPNELLESSFAQKIENLSRIPNGKYVVAEENSEVVAHAFLEPLHLTAIQHSVQLTIAVHPGFQERGIGMLTLSHLIEWAQNTSGVEKIELNVRASNLRAIRLYQKLGFHFEGRIRHRLKISKEIYLDDLKMGLFVKSTPPSLPTIALPIGKVLSSRKEAIDDNWDDVQASIQLDSDQFQADALAGLETFSHVEVIFQMNQVDVRKIETSARHPRNNLDWPKVGIFAQRGKNRPNQIGTTICRVLKVDGLNLSLQGLDAIDGTPVLDIKPWMQEFGPRGDLKQPTWSSELMKGYWQSP